MAYKGVSPDHYALWVSGEIDGQFVRFGVECRKPFVPRATDYLKRVARRQGLGTEVVTEEIYSIGEKRWDT